MIIFQTEIKALQAETSSRPEAENWPNSCVCGKEQQTTYHILRVASYTTQAKDLTTEDVENLRLTPASVKETDVIV